MRASLCLALCVFVARSPLGLAAEATDFTTYGRFEVIEENGRVARTAPQRPGETPRWAAGVSQAKFEWAKNSSATAVFKAPVPFVIPPSNRAEPFYPHNHCPAIAWLPNGDVLAIWFSTIKEQGTEMSIVASRLRAGAKAWEPAAEFFKAARRNMTGSSLFYDETAGVLHHLNGLGREAAEGWENLALLHRCSRDNGVTWSVARPVSTGTIYQRGHQVIAGLLRTRGGVLVQACDATPGGQGASTLHLSHDEGQTWSEAGGDIRGIHAGVVDLAGGNLLALGRAQAIKGRMPMSLSADLGRTWKYSATEFPAIGGAQRLALLRLREGPLLLVSFTGEREGRTGLSFTNAAGGAFEGFGLFAAASYDEGKTWPRRKLLTAGDGAYEVGAYFGANVKRDPVVRTTPTRAETEGYLAAAQSPDGMVHLLSSRLYYRFNLAWLETPAPGTLTPR